MRDQRILIRPLLTCAAIAAASLLALSASAAVPGITGHAPPLGTVGNSTFNLTAAPGYVSMPDGTSIYSWGYGCNDTPAGFVPAAIQPPTANCPSMQLPGPTLVVTQGDTVTVTLHNNLPAAAGNTSILFPGFNVCAATLNDDGTCTGTPTGTAGVLTQEAMHNSTVTYTFKADTAGTHSYYSGTQGDLQIEMGLYGALIVVPATGGGVPTGYTSPADQDPPLALPDSCYALGEANLPMDHEDFRLAAAAYNHTEACYDREYIFQFAALDPAIHQQAENQKNVECLQPTGCMVVATEPYVPAYFLINGRSMPDVMDPEFALQYPHQPYNANPHMHPGESMLQRIIGSDHWQHPFHQHGNHTRILGRDGHMLLTPPTTDGESDSDRLLAGPVLFTTTTTPGQAFDGIFQWTGKGLNWDVYGHCTSTGLDSSGAGKCADSTTANPVDHTAACYPDANGYYTQGSSPQATPDTPNYYEWCADHGIPLESKPFGQVGAGGPVTLPDANLFANGPWYGGSPYLGPDANTRAVGNTPIPPSGTVANNPTEEAGFAFIWHSHNERELTTNNAFPGGMFMMMLVDPWVYAINEAN
jgi:Multicopper oxidase